MFHKNLCIPFITGGLLLIAGCQSSTVEHSYPVDQEHRLKESRGKLTGEGLSLFGKDDDKNATGQGIGVNAVLWRASMDTISFMPLTSADPFGGVIITDWYEDPKTQGERFKATVLILDKTLRADGVKVKLFKQIKDAQGAWKDAPVSEGLAKDMENTILTRAREINVNQNQK